MQAALAILGLIAACWVANRLGRRARAREIRTHVRVMRSHEFLAEHNDPSWN